MSAIPSVAARRPPAAAFLLLAALSLCWGLNWPIVKVALVDIPVLPFRALCVLISGPVLLGIAVLRGNSILIPRREIAPLLLAAFLNVTTWHVLSAYGVLLMPAGRASIIAYTMPAWAILFSAIILHEPLTARGILGLALGMMGIAVLVLPDLKHITAAPLGALSMVAAAIVWGAGTVAAKRVWWTPSVAVFTGWQICLGGLPILLAAMITGPFPGLDHAGTAAIIALIYVVVLGMLFAQWAWFTVLGQLPVAVASIGSLAIPVIGVLSSALLLHEALGAAEIGALVLVVAALALVLYRPPTPRR